MWPGQIEMVSVEDLVPQNHAYRKLKELIDFEVLTKSVKIEEKELGARGYSIVRLIMCLILQFMENLSDREFERFVAENVAGKWFCDFTLLEKTPDYTTFCKFRNKLGLDEIEKILKATRQQLKEKGYFAEVFTFIDATALVSKLSNVHRLSKKVSN